MSQESRPDVTGILPGCHRISARIRREGWPDGAGILNGSNIRYHDGDFDLAGGSLIVS